MVTGGTLPPYEVIVIADDLTGACDTAVAFSMQGMKTEVVLDWRAIKDVPVEVIAINTESRDIPIHEARQKLKAAANQLNLKRFPHIFKKVDSAFRGNTLDEIVAVIEEFPFDLAMMVPAYPRLGRTSTSGVVRIRDLSGERTFAIRDALEESGLKICHIDAGSEAEEIAEALEKNHRGERQLVYCDAMSEKDLQVIVTEGRKLAVRTLWIGSAGLAHALASDLAADVSHKLSAESLGCDSSIKLLGSIFFFIGSDHLVTQTQISFLREEHDVVDCAFNSPASDPSPEAGAFLMPVKRGATTEIDISRALKWVRPDKLSCLFMTGGDTATLVCSALGIQALQLQDEFAPGLPRSLAVGGPFAGSTVILKSGGFGDTDVLSRIAKAYLPNSQKNEVAH